MFRNRRNSQKPNEDFYTAFKQSHPSAGGAAVHGATTTADVADAMAAIMPAASSASFSNALTDTALDAGHFDSDDLLKGSDLSPHDEDQWRLTPSLMDPGSFSFANLPNQHSGYYTPTPGGMNTIYHNPAAGDLHTPGISFNLGTPLSMSLTDAALNAAPTFDMPGFHPQVFQNPDYGSQPVYHQQHQTQQQSQVYPPQRMLVHQDSGYDAMDGSPDNDFDMNSSSAHDPAGSLEPPSRIEQATAVPMPTSTNNFRYQVTLNAPTAMVRQSDEIPITYLNKGQAYTISIVDSQPAARSPAPVKYRTVVRISFEDDQQRQRPSSCWQLWKEGRGLSESHQRGGKLQAVEFVDPHPGAEEDPRQPRVELENASFDCFSVTWTPSIATTTADCSVAVRFNFLSTDFSHSKGVKGIPVRLCAKTTQLVDDAEMAQPAPAAEVCYCKVKLFRDHGAERKLSNDIAHVKKTIEKLKQQIAQVEAGIKDPSKRKRTASLAMTKLGERPSKIQKRTWSLSSADGTPSGRPAIEDDLHQRLAAVQAMFGSTRPVSVLYLQGGEQDDPDLFPVALPSDRADGKSGASGKQSWPEGSDLSPTGASSTGSPVSSTQGDQMEFKRPRKPRTESADWPMSATLPSTNFNQALDSIRGPPVKVKKNNGAMIDAVDVDPTYVPPPQQAPKPIACFYAQIVPPSDSGSVESRKPQYYRAVYLSQRDVGALVSGIASKSSLDPARIQRTVRTTPAGLEVLVDDEVVRELPEGQDMRVTFAEASDAPEIKQEERLTVPGTSPHPDSNVTTPMEGTPLEMRLAF